jgi:hypothetical protein
VPTTSSPVFVDEIGKAAGWTAISKLGYRLSRIGAGVLASVSLKNVIQPTLIVRVPWLACGRRRPQCRCWLYCTNPIRGGRGQRGGQHLVFSSFISGGIATTGIFP